MTDRDREDHRWKLRQIENARRAARNDAAFLSGAASFWLENFGQWEPEVEPVDGFEFGDIIAMMRAIAAVDPDKHAKAVAEAVAERLEVI